MIRRDGWALSVGFVLATQSLFQTFTENPAEELTQRQSPGRKEEARQAQELRTFPISRTARSLSPAQLFRLASPLLPNTSQFKSSIHTEGFPGVQKALGFMPSTEINQQINQSNHYWLIIFLIVGHSLYVCRGVCARTCWYMRNSGEVSLVLWDRVSHLPLNSWIGYAGWIG